MEEQALIEVDPQFEAGLDGLNGFDYLWVLTWLGQESSEGSAPELELKQTPFLLRPSSETVGIFATRGPRRPNPVGLSLVRLLSVEGNLVRFRGVDMVDGTPVIDLKPYVTRFDRPGGEPVCGWFDTVSMPIGASPATLDESAGR
jgi:tRNA-Thr(GGU) m(6)t(6)A37 methyltransferase TsaA